MLASDLDPTRIPGHIACVMDGNGRWAEQRGLPDLARLIVPHPIGGLKPEAVRAKAAPSTMLAMWAAVIPVVAWWLCRW